MGVFWQVPWLESTQVGSSCFFFFAGRKDGGCWSVLGPLE